MKRIQIKRPVRPTSRKKAGGEQSPDLLPLTAREFMKLPGVLGLEPPDRDTNDDREN